MQPTVVGCSLHADPQRSSLSLLTHISTLLLLLLLDQSKPFVQLAATIVTAAAGISSSLHYWWRFCLHCRLSVCLSVCMFVSKRIQTVIGGTLFHTRLRHHHHHHHHHLFAQINWTRRRTHDQHENKSRTRKTQKTGAYILPIKTKDQTHSI